MRFNIVIIKKIFESWLHILFFFIFFSGHITITNFLLNYYPGLDIEKRNIHGFTALMKASIQGRTDCVRALMLAGKCILKNLPFDLSALWLDVRSEERKLQCDSSGHPKSQTARGYKCITATQSGFNSTKVECDNL